MIFKLIKFRLLVRKGPGYPFEYFTPSSVSFGPTGVQKAVFTDGEGEEHVVEVDWDRVYLLEYAGAFDKVGNEIFHGDVLKDSEGVLYEVLSIHGGFAILDKDGEPIFLSDAIARTMVVEGNVVMDPTIGQPAAEDLEKVIEGQLVQEPTPELKKVIRLRRKK